MRTFLKNGGCQRKASYNCLDPSVKPLSPGHNCCEYCTVSCGCKNGLCDYQKKAYELERPVIQNDNGKRRTITESDKQELMKSLIELQSMFVKPNRSAFGCMSSMSFTSELINAVVDNAHKILSLPDILKYAPVFNMDHAIQILEILAESFNDFDDSALLHQTDNLQQLQLNCSTLDELLRCEFDEDASE